jgi:hypothetical protein
MPVELPVTLGKRVLLVLFHSLVTDFALFALPDSSAPTHLKVPSHALRATIKIRWDLPTALFVLPVTRAKIVPNNHWSVQKVITHQVHPPIVPSAMQDIFAIRPRQIVVPLVAFAPAADTAQLQDFLCPAQQEHLATFLVLQLRCTA